MTMEEKERQMLTLTLPLIELEEGKKPWSIEAYDGIETGMYFVKDTAGVFHIAEVDRDENVCFHTPLPARACNVFTREMVVDELSVDMERMCQTQEEMYGKIAQLIFDCRRHYDDLNGRLEGISSAVIDRLDEMVEGKDEFMKQSAGRGYVSEETLAQIIKVVRK